MWEWTSAKRLQKYLVRDNTLEEQRHLSDISIAFGQNLPHSNPPPHPDRLASSPKWGSPFYTLLPNPLNLTANLGKGLVREGV